MATFIFFRFNITIPEISWIQSDISKCNELWSDMDISFCRANTNRNRISRSFASLQFHSDQDHRNVDSLYLRARKFFTETDLSSLHFPIPPTFNVDLFLDRGYTYLHFIEASDSFIFFCISNQTPERLNILSVNKKLCIYLNRIEMAK